MKDMMQVLVERIESLEQRVQALEMRPPINEIHHHYAVPPAPAPYYLPAWPPDSGTPVWGGTLPGVVTL